MSPAATRKPTAVEIVRATAAHFNMRVQQIMGPSRHATVTRARHIAMYLIRDLCDMSYPQIGLLFQRDHSGVITAVRKVGAEGYGEYGTKELVAVRAILAEGASDCGKAIDLFCPNCNRMRAENEMLRAQLGEAYQLLDGSK